MNLRAFFCIIILLFLSSCTTKNNLDVLYSFDTEKMGSSNMKVIIEELEHHGNYSLIREKVYDRGSYAGSIMFSLCTSSVVAKKRGYSHFAILNSKECGACESCEMSWDRTLGFLNNVPQDLIHSPGDKEETENEKELRLEKAQQYLKQVFPSEIITEDNIEITSINDFWLICKNVSNICSW